MHVDVSQALLLDGVVSAWTYDDISDLPAIGFRLTPRPELIPTASPCSRVARCATSGSRWPSCSPPRPTWQGWSDRVDLEIDPLPAHLDPDAVPTAWIDGEQATWAANTGEQLPDQDSEATTFVEEYGDVDAAFARADALELEGTHRVFTMDARIGRHTGVPLECRGLVATYDEAEQQLVVDGAAKVPFWNREAIAAMAGLSPHRVVVRETHVGGGFGPRGELYPEDVLVTVAAMRLRRPIKWIEDRQEHLVATNHSRGQHHRSGPWCGSDGFIEAMDDEFTLDQGAYVRRTVPRSPR